MLSVTSVASARYCQIAEHSVEVRYDQLQERLALLLWVVSF